MDEKLELERGVSERPPFPLPLGPTLATVTLGCGYGTEADALFLGPVSLGRLVFDVSPVSNGVDVAFDSG